jgi:hypothetical protein
VPLSQKSDLLFKTLKATLLVVALAAAFFVLVMRILPGALDLATKEATAASSQDLIMVFRNLVYPEIAEDLGLAGNDMPMPLAGAALERVDRQVRGFAANSKIAKLKIFCLKGSIIYSTDIAQIGERFSETDEAFLHAIRGRSFSEIERKDSYEGLSGAMRDVVLAATYVPIRDDTNTVVGVIEIYVDRTEVQRQIDTEKSEMLAILIVGFAAVGGATFWAIWSQLVRVRASVRIEAG